MRDIITSKREPLAAELRAAIPARGGQARPEPDPAEAGAVAAAVPPAAGMPRLGWA
jgi:hypothetical protein